MREYDSDESIVRKARKDIIDSYNILVHGAPSIYCVQYITNRTSSNVNKIDEKKCLLVYSQMAPPKKW